MSRDKAERKDRWVICYFTLFTHIKITKITYQCILWVHAFFTKVWYNIWVFWRKNAQRRKIYVKEEVKMEAGLIIGNQIIIMFIILIIGAFCYLKGIITKDGTKQLSSFALNIINPVLIFMSYQSKYDKTLVHGLLWSFLLSAISYAVTILLTYVLIRT